MNQTTFMTKKFVFSVIALAMAVSPFLSVNADNGNWDAALSAAAWNYGEYRVERLAFASDAVGPFNLGGYTVIAEPVGTCDPEDCAFYDVYFLKDGYKMFVNNVPGDVVDRARLNANDGRFVFVSALDESNDHYAVTEYGTDGTATTLVDDVFFSGVESIDTMVDDVGNVYFNTALDFTGKTTVDQAGVYVYDEAEGDADIIGVHWELRDESLEDAADGRVLIKMTFPSGNKQLWIGDTHNENYYGMTRSAIDGTWVDADADVYAAHFVDADTVEFFMNYTRYTYDLGTEVLAKYDGQFLNWYRSAEDAYQIVGSRMAWLDPSDVLSVSDGTTVKTLGTATGGAFLLESDRVFYASGSEGKMYDFATGVTTSIPFVVTDSDGGDVVVGNDSLGNVAYLNMATGETYQLGFGGAPALSDDMHVYWQGKDGAMYEGTVSLPSIASAGTVSAVKVSGSNTVYLVKDGEKLAFPSEKTYFTWFSSWSSVKTVSASTLASYEDGGTATFAPGTKAKLAGDARVYVVGNDNALHWVTSETAAYSIFGKSWNKGILSITQQDLVTNPIGASVDSENALKSV